MVWWRVDTRVPSTMSTVSLRNRLRGLEREQRAEVVDDAVGRGLRETEERGKRHPVFQRKRPRAAHADRICTSAAQRGHQLSEVARGSAR